MKSAGKVDHLNGNFHFLAEKIAIFSKTITLSLDVLGTCLGYEKTFPGQGEHVSEFFSQKKLLGGPPGANKVQTDKYGKK